MNDNDLVAIWATRSALSRKHGDDISADYWADQATQLSDRIEAAQARHCVTFDALKGSPDHTGLTHA